MEQTTNPQFPGQIAQRIPTSVVNKFPTVNRKNQLFILVAVLVVILSGIATGYLLSGKSGSKLLSSTTSVAPGAKSAPNEAGVSDTSAFPDNATGELAEGGIAGEGTHHLVRPGGDSQNVYLTSTVIDLQAFVGKKVEVWGQTVKGKKAGWLMDVGKIKVIQ